MDLMNSVASASMTMSAAQLQQQYSISVAKKSMDVQEIAMEELLRMLPESVPAKGTYIDVYA